MSSGPRVVEDHKSEPKCLNARERWFEVEVEAIVFCFAEQQLVGACLAAVASLRMRVCRVVDVSCEIVAKQ